MSTQSLIYQPQRSGFYSLAVYIMYLIAGIGFLMIVSRASISFETVGIGILVLAVIFFTVYIRYQKIVLSNENVSIVSTGFNPLDIVLPRTMELSKISQINAIRMLPKDLRGDKAIPSHIEFIDQHGKTMIFNRWFHQPKEVTLFLQSIAQHYPEIKFNQDVQTLLTGTY